MADNPTVDNGGLTDYAVATDDDGSAQHQYVKVEFGADNTQTKVTSSVGLPVAGTGSAGTAATGVVTVQGIASGTVVPTSNATTSVVGTGTEATAQRVTIATDSTGVLSVDDNGSTLSIDDGGGIITVDGTVAVTYATTGSGTATGALRVELPSNGTGVVGLNAGTNAIGKLAANSGIDIGDVDVTSIVPGTGATNAGKAVDSVAGATDTGVAMLAVRDDALTTLTPADGDYTHLRTDNTGALQVNIASGTATISGAVDATLLPGTTGGLATMAATSQDSGTALTSTAQAIKGSAGQLFGWYIYNPNDEVSYVNFYNTAQGSVTVGTTVPLFHLAIPPASGANVLNPIGITFGTAMSWSATKTAGSNTAPDVAFEAVAFYK